MAGLFVCCQLHAFAVVASMSGCHAVLDVKHKTVRCTCSLFSMNAVWQVPKHRHTVQDACCVQHCAAHAGVTPHSQVAVRWCWLRVYVEALSNLHMRLFRPPYRHCNNTIAVATLMMGGEPYSCVFRWKFSYQSAAVPMAHQPAILPGSAYI